ncbi:MAG: TerC/Alx family metal homeostasis membrane protein, partial [Actinobacteria bacterium]|nr:TerC/Alx family metal homeostasis membrane protein [Actinomycetota bacterium]
MTAAPWEWWALLGLLVATFVLDGLIVDRRPHNFSPREAGVWVGIYVSLAGLVAFYIWMQHGSAAGGQFIAGYLTEYSLSVDNLFVFLVLMSSFAVPTVARHRVLRIGVALSLILRGALIVLGAAAVEKFEATLFLFAVLLAWTAIQVWRTGDAEPDPEGHAVVRWLERRVPVTREYHGNKLLVRVESRRLATPMLIVILAIGVSNVLFAVDSIPAIFGLTTDPYIIVASNACALMGLR